MKRYLKKLRNRSFQSALALLLSGGLVLTALPHHAAAQQVRLGDQVARSLLLLVREAAALATNREIQGELQLARKFLEDAGSHRGSGDEVQVYSFSRVRDILRTIVDQPRDEKSACLEKVTKALRLLDEYTPSRDQVRQGSEVIPAERNRDTQRSSGDGDSQFRCDAVHSGQRQSGQASLSCNGFITGGLIQTQFDTLQGSVTVNLPDDAAAGDTISGTVIAEPRGKTAAEQAKNRDELNGYVVEIDRQETRPDNPFFKSLIPTSASLIPVVLKNKDGDAIARALVPVKPKEKTQFSPYQGREQSQTRPKEKDASLPETSAYQTPSVAQAGKPLQVKGAFDGDLETSAVRVANATLQLLAESPRKLVAQGTDLTGSLQIEVMEQGKTVANCRVMNLAIRLQAEKLNLLRGEQTTMTVTVLGLDGAALSVSSGGDRSSSTALILPAVRLINKSPAVVRMAGGDAQSFNIDPRQVQAGAYTTVRTLTGVQPGGFAINATLEQPTNAVGREAAARSCPSPGQDTARNFLPSPGPADSTPPAGTMPPAKQSDNRLNTTINSGRGDVVTTRNDPRPVFDRERSRPRESEPRSAPCDSFSRRLQEAAEDTRFEIVLDDPAPQPGQIFTARVVPTSTEVRLVGTELSIPEPGGSSLYAQMEVSWRVTDSRGDLGPADVSTPDGRSALRSNPVRLSLPPAEVVEAGTAPRPTSQTSLSAYVVLKSSCGGTSLTSSRGDEMNIRTDPVFVPARVINLPALQVPTLLVLFRNPNFSSAISSLNIYDFNGIGGAALIVWRPNFRAGPLEPNTLLGTIDPSANPARATALVIQYLRGIDARLLQLSRAFPGNQMMQGLDTYRTSLDQMRQALQRHMDRNQNSIVFRTTNELRQLNFPFIEGPTLLNNVNVEDEVSSLIFTGAQGKTLEIFNAPNLETGEGVLSITTDYPGFSAVLSNLRVYTRGWARAFPDGEVIDGGATVRILHPPAGNLLRPLVGNFEDQISSLRLR